MPYSIKQKLNKKTLLTSDEALVSKESNISWMIEISCCMQESQGMKAD